MRKVTITSATLNIRRQPNPTSDQVGQYTQGELVEVLAEVESRYLRGTNSNWLYTGRGWIAKAYTQPAYSGPEVSFSPALHAPGSDWMWQLPEIQDLMRFVDLPVKFLSIGFSPDYWATFHKPQFHLVRLYWQHGGHKRTPAEVWEFARRDILRFYNQGARKFELLNEPNLRHEGLGVVWKDGAEFGRFLANLALLIKADCPEAELYYPGLSPGLPWTNQFTFLDASWPHVKELCHGLCMHAYSGTTNNVDTAVNDILTQVKGFQQRYALDRPLVVSECSVNRAAPAEYKANVYVRLERILKTLPGVEALVYFISHWEAPPEQAAHQEGWLNSGLPQAYKNLQTL